MQKNCDYYRTTCCTNSKWYKINRPTTIKHVSVKAKQCVNGCKEIRYVDCGARKLFALCELQ